ncbi:DsbA family protein [Nostocaceae cyanobacterium CENA369]|jgi:2-hydroxychromene-2-carboxylate isomerase|uniref:DsbA family protein n=1 Tax=Dendronalium phyllosphericum CENA369 TaxID=1725256 RepID=A0A8J7LGU6_9NOST|nr:DsbA family protein [Dendronalium phyllosphericum]MBH8576686.1 DsbA family protein [Dendronalium phyllosphericum CENA369]
MIEIDSYTIYHSPNAYIGITLLNRALSGTPVIVQRRPICIPKERGIMVADLLGSKESLVKGSYHREDCIRWAEKFGIELNLIARDLFQERAKRWIASPLNREELPARAYYAALGSGKESLLDQALFRAAWVDGMDVNEEEVIKHCISSSGLDCEHILNRAFTMEITQMLNHSMNLFTKAGCPGIPTWVIEGERFWGKDRVDWLVEKVRSILPI